MGREDEFKDKLSKDDVLEYIDELENESDQKKDKGTRDTLVSAVTGVIGTDIAELEMNLRVSHSEYIISRSPSSALGQCLSGLPVAVLRGMLEFIIRFIEAAIPPNFSIKVHPGIKKSPEEVQEILGTMKGIYVGDLKTRMKKNLVEDAYTLLTDRNVSGCLMLGMGPESRKAYIEAINGGSDYSFYAVTHGLLYVFGGKLPDETRPFSYSVPDELKAIWLSLPEEELRQCDTIENYAASAANLYGAITVTEVLDLIRRYDAEQDSGAVSLASMDSKEIMSVIQLRTFDDDCVYHFCFDENTDDDYIISDNYREYLINRFSDNDGFTFYYNDMNEDKPRYFPSKSEFLRYADPRYYEHTPEIDELRSYIQTKYGKQIASFVKHFHERHIEGLVPMSNDEELDFIMEELHNLFAAEDITFEEMTDVLAIRYIALGDAELSELFKYISAARDKTHTWYIKGNLPEDHLSMTVPQSYELYEEEPEFLQMNMFDSSYGISEPDKADVGIPAMPDVTETVKNIPYKADVKPGRNDPCSCGSGKKYKKCCGR